MPERVRLEKNFFSFNQGLNTDSSEIAFPDGFSTDERNYELLLDGSRRRRRGLAQESGGSDKTVSSTGGICQSFVWTNVGGDPEKTFIVHKLFDDLYFTDDTETVSTTFHSDTIDLASFRVASGNPSQKPVCFSSGRGYLIVTGELIDPLIIEYRAATDDFQVTTAYPCIRDYSDQTDGTLVSQFPTTLSAAVRYNLLNRGWTDSEITTYYTDDGSTRYPNKSVPPWKAYARSVDDVTYINEDGVKVFNHAKYTGERVSSSSARTGALLVSPRDSSFATYSAADVVDITTWSYVDNGATWEATITTGSAHDVGEEVEITIENLASVLAINTLTYSLHYWDGSYTTKAGTTGSTIVVDFVEPSGFTGMLVREQILGSVTKDESITRPDGSAISVGPCCNEFHDGRVFYAGINDSEWSDYIFFSQIPDKIEKFKRCYQVADPTDEENNQLVDTDGGWFVIQGIQNVKTLLSVRNVLLVFAENGVWEVGGGERGFFTPSGYSIRKITDVGCNSPMSPIAIENLAIYTGPEGIYTIGPNPYTGILEATSLSVNKIQEKWNAISENSQKHVQTVYDSAKKQIWFLYGKTTVQTSAATGYYNEALLLDLRIGAFSYYSYNRDLNVGIVSAFPISYTTSSEQKNKIKFNTAVNSSTNLRICDHDQSDYIDFDGSESPLPYVVTGWDNIGDFQRRRQAPVITVYAKRTETGYTDSGSGWSGDNESSNLMTAYWDWTNDDVSGKIGDQQETYRHVRAFTPADATDVDGYPVVVTRNKVRGRGRVLQLRFDGAATKDSHLLGYTVNYRAQAAI